MLQKRAVTQAKATLLRVSPPTHTPINIAAKNVLLICGRINTGQSKRRQSCITGHLWMWSGTCKPAEAHMFISISLLIFFLKSFFGNLWRGELQNHGMLQLWKHPRLINSIAAVGYVHIRVFLGDAYVNTINFLATNLMDKDMIY